jgi:hypothetical protein
MNKLTSSARCPKSTIYSTQRIFPPENRLRFPFWNLSIHKLPFVVPSVDCFCYKIIGVFLAHILLSTKEVYYIVLVAGLCRVIPN